MATTASSAPLVDLEEGRNISQLQYVLKLAHSPAVADQQKAAVELSKMVEGTVFPAVSFGPLAHALCRLIPSENRTVAYYAARAVKTLLLDDALRGQALMVGLPTVLVDAVAAWQEEVPCLREILAALQTLTWDKYAVSQVVDAGAITPLLALLQTHDSELRILATAAVANALAFCDTTFLANTQVIDNVTEAMGVLLELVKSRERMQRCYAAAAIANACAHPVLAGKIKELHGLELMQKIEKSNLAFGGSRITECAETAIARLSEGGGDVRQALKKYTFKWGNRPMMELTLDTKRNRVRVYVCLAIWVICILVLLHPILLPKRQLS